MKNRRCFGAMQLHRIEQRNEKPNVQEVPKKSQLKDGQKLIEEVDQVVSKSSAIEQLKSATPRYSLVSTRDGTKLIVARIPIWQTNQIENVSLSVIAQDCLSVKCENGQDIVNISLPSSVEPQKSKAIFNKSTKILTILLPLV